MCTSAPVYHGSSLDLVGLTMAYGDFDVIRDVNRSRARRHDDLRDRSSGSGKSTLLRGINRLHEPKSGDVLIAGESTLEVNRTICAAGSGWCSSTSTCSPTTPRWRTSPWRRGR